MDQINQDCEILKFNLNDINDRIFGYTLKERLQHGIKTLRDMIDFNHESYFMNLLMDSSRSRFIFEGNYQEYKSKLKKSELAELYQKKILQKISERIKLAEDHNNNYSSTKSLPDLDPKTLSISLEFLANLTSENLMQALIKINLIAVKDLLIFDERKLFIIDKFDLTKRKAFFEFKSKIINNPALIIEIFQANHISPEEELFNEQCLSDKIPEKLIYSNGGFVKKQDFLEQNISDIPVSDMDKLRYVFIRSNIKTIKDVLDCKASQLQIFSDNRVQIFKAFFNFRKELINRPKKYCYIFPEIAEDFDAELFFTKYPHFRRPQRIFSFEIDKSELLPVKLDMSGNESPLEIFKAIVMDYIIESIMSTREDNIMSLFYGIYGQKQTIDDIVKNKNINKNICRNNLSKDLENFRKLLKGKRIKFPPFTIRKDALALFSNP